MIRRAISAYIKVIKNIMAKPSWKHRRRYIFGSFVIGAIMLIGSTIVSLGGNGSDVGDLVTGGVALISLILTSYIFGAVWEDKSLHNTKEENIDE